MRPSYPSKFSRIVSRMQYLSVEELRERYHEIVGVEFSRGIPIFADPHHYLRIINRSRKDRIALTKEANVIRLLLRNHFLIHSGYHPSSIAAQVNSHLQEHLSKDSPYYYHSENQATSIAARWALDDSTVTLN